MSINQITTKMLDKIIVPLPDEEIIDEFTKFVLEIEQKIDSSQSKISALKGQRQNAICNHFT